MYREKPAKLFAKYALPQMLGLLLNSVYLIVDGIFIGNRLGREAMAAAAVSVPVIEFLIAAALFISSGAGILISGSLGRKKPAEASRMFNLSVWALGAISVAAAVLGNLFINPLATLLGATPDIHPQATEYLWYIVTFSPFLLFSFLLSGLARNDNRPKLAMAALVAGSVSNIILDYVFMYPLNMGIAGAALATALGPVFSVIILLPHFLRKKGALRFGRPESPRALRRMFVLGFPAFIMEFSIGIVTFLYNFAIVRCGYGELGLAAYLIIGYLSLIILTLFLGAAQGLQPVFSYYHGAGCTQKSDDLLSFSKKMLLGGGILLYLLVLLFSRGFVSFFASGDPELALFTTQKVSLYFWGFFFAGYNILMISFWQSVNRAGKALLVSLLRSVILLPVLLALVPLAFGAQGIWACHSLAEAGAAIAAAAISLAGKRRAGRQNTRRPAQR